MRDDEIWHDSDPVSGTWIFTTGEEQEKLYLSKLRVRFREKWFRHRSDTRWKCQYHKKPSVPQYEKAENAAGIAKAHDKITVNSYGKDRYRYERKI